MQNKDVASDNLLQGLKLAVTSSNLFFRTLRAHGVFVEEPSRSVVLTAGQRMCDFWFCTKPPTCTSVDSGQ